MSLQDKINAFWQYLQDNLNKIDESDFMKLIRDMPADNVESQKIYNNVFTIGNNIYKGVSVHFRVSYINLPSGVVDLIGQKYGNSVLPILHRIELLITSNGDVNTFPVIQQIYLTAKNYNIHNVVPIKFFPHNLITPRYVIFNNFHIKSEHMSYSIQTQDNKLDLIITIADEVINAIIKTQQDIYELRDVYINYLEHLFGEYNTHMYITKFTVIPLALYNMTFTNTLKNFSEFYTDVWNNLPKHQVCNVCKLSDINVNVKNNICDDCDTGLNNLNAHDVS